MTVGELKKILQDISDDVIVTHGTENMNMLDFGNPISNVLKVAGVSKDKFTYLILIAE